MRADLFTNKFAPNQFYGAALANGNYENAFTINKFGANPVAATGDDLWDNGTALLYGTTAEAIEVISDDVNDIVGTAGTGATEITVQGLDANYDRQTVSGIALNGTTAVAISSTWIRVFRAWVTAAGSSGANEGTLTIRVASAGATRALISPLKNQSLMAAYTIPKDYTGFLQRWRCKAAKNVGAAIEVTHSLRFRPLGEVFQVKQQEEIASIGVWTDTKFDLPLVIPAKADVKMTLDVVSAVAVVSGSFDLLCVRTATT